MASTYSVTQAMAWGITPQWVNATLNKQSGYQTSTSKSSKKNSWGTKTYYSTTYNYPTTIQPDGFTLSNWNTYSNSTKGTKSNNTFGVNGDRYYGITTNSGAWVINYKTSTKNWQASGGSTWTQVSNSTGTSISAKTTIYNNTPTSATYNVTLTQGVTNTSSSQLSSAWSNSTTLALGSQISAQYEAIGVQFSTTLTQSNTISGSSTSSQSSSDSQSLSRSLSQAIPAYTAYEFVLTINNSKAGFGWTAPFLIDTNDVHWTADQNASFTMGAGEAANDALTHGYPSEALRYYTNDKAYGVFAGTSASDYNSEAKISTYVVSSSESDSGSLQASRSSLSSANSVNSQSASLMHRPRPTVNGFGFSINTDRVSQLLRGSTSDDRLFSREFGNDGKILKGKETFLLFEGNDVASSYSTQDNVQLRLSGLKTITTRGGKDIVEAKAPDQNNSFSESVIIDVGSGKDAVRFSDLSRSQFVSSFITLGSGKDTVDINLQNRGQAQFLFTDFQPGQDHIQFEGMDGGNLVFVAAPGGQLVGYYNDTKLLHFRSDFLGAASNRYTLNKSTEKYEVAFLNFGYYSLDTMPSTLTDLFVQFAGQSVTSLNKELFTSWKQVQASQSYSKALARKVVNLGAGPDASAKDRDQLTKYGIASIAKTDSVFEWINGLENDANKLGINLTLPSGF